LIQDAVIEDLNYILKQNFPGQRLTSIKLPFRHTRSEQQQIILQLFNYRLCDSSAKAELESKARRVAMLSIQPIYILHSSSDGQRMETQIDTINARYSPKYFGLQKGVSAYTLVANHVPISVLISELMMTSMR
jgi:Tn3 transposase DDE domain/Domain of unknown function (DUF4158)